MERRAFEPFAPSRTTRPRKKNLHLRSLAQHWACRPPIPPLGCLFSFFLLLGTGRKKKTGCELLGMSVFYRKW